MDKVYLVLENGEVFVGKGIGVKGEAIGEVVFNTEMLGYLETLTDCGNYGQIVAQTFPLIGNYGIVESGAKGDKVYLNGYIARNICDEPSNFMSTGNLNDYLVAHNVVGICDIDTRHLTKIIREQGVMNGIITSQSVLSDIQKKQLKEFKIKSALENTCQKGVTGAFSKTAAKKVVVWNFGDSADIKQQLERKGCEVVVVNYDATAEEILQLNPSGVVLSSGAGNPSENVNVIKQIALVCKSKVAVFGINLGHLMLALAKSGKIVKMKFGHHGANQPIKCINSYKIFVTSQNHSYAVDINSFDKTSIVEDFKNINDGTCEGLTYVGTKQFSVQFCPTYCDSPMDTSFLYNKFIDSLEG